VVVNGARRFGVYPRKGTIREGADADLTVVDLERDSIVDPEKLFTAARDVAGLYAGRRFRGAVDMTIVGGRVVFENGRVTGQPGDGRFVPGLSREDAAS
jgi:dihydroorotase-like cyclic amidohydrolase